MGCSEGTPLDASARRVQAETLLHPGDEPTTPGSATSGPSADSPSVTVSIPQSQRTARGIRPAATLRVLARRFLPGTLTLPLLPCLTFGL